MRGVLLETGNMSETMVAKMVIVSMIATPENVFLQISNWIFHCQSSQLKPPWQNFPCSFFPMLLKALIEPGPTALIFPLKFANDISKTSHTRESQKQYVTKLNNISCCPILLALWSISAQILVVSIRATISSK